MINACCLIDEEIVSCLIKGKQLEIAKEYAAISLQIMRDMPEVLELAEELIKIGELED